MFADFRIDGFPKSCASCRDNLTTLSKIILRVHGKAQPQTIIDCREWLTGPEKNTDSADETGPAVSRDS
jgi:hypothetical protein